MGEGGAFSTLKRKLSFQPLFHTRRHTSKLRRVTSFDSLGSSTKSTSTSSTSSTSPSLKGTPFKGYLTLKLNDELSLSIGDSFESNPSSKPEGSAQFEYGPLRYPKQIRLLLVLPAVDPDDPLETILFHAQIGEVPFQALSLHWTESSKTRNIHCNGFGLDVPESLSMALFAMRNISDSRAISIVWTDAVCINHSDMREHEAHLRTVREIFNTGIVTTVWLGGKEGRSCRVFETVDMLHEACQCDAFRARLENHELDVSSLEHLSIGDKTLEISYENRQELSRLFSQPWFDRVSAWQEVPISKKTFVLYGSGVRPWSYLADAAWCMQKLDWEATVNEDFSLFGGTRQLKYDNVLTLNECREGVLSNRPYALLELISASRNFVATQPLDRLTALHGLLSDTREHSIVDTFLDYRLSALTIFLNLTINLMLCQETLDVLHLVSTDPMAEPNWPSFVPNLSCRKIGRQLGSRQGRDFWEYHAAGDTRPSLRIINGRKSCGTPIAHFEDDVHIALTGLVVDEIETVGSEMKGGQMKVASFLADWVNGALMTNGRKYYTTNELRKAQNVLMSPAYQAAAGPTETIPGPNGSGMPATRYEQSRETGGAEFPRPTSRRPSVGSSIGEFTINSRRPSLVGIASRRPYVTPETQAQLRNSLAPALLNALKVLDPEASPDSPTLPPEMMSMSVAHPKHAGESSGITSSLPQTKYPVGGISEKEAFWRTLIRDRDIYGARPDPSMQNTHFERWFEAANGGVSSMLDALQAGRGPGAERAVSDFNSWVHESSNGSKIMRTKNGYIGTGPRYMEEGDLVCILYGGQTPFVLRREAWGNYRFVGDCYVHGIMSGEAMGMDLDETEFVLV